MHPVPDLFPKDKQKTSDRGPVKPEKVLVAVVAGGILAALATSLFIGHKYGDGNFFEQKRDPDFKITAPAPSPK